MNMFVPQKRKERKRKKAACSHKTFLGSFEVLCFLLGLELSMLLFICISHLWVRQCPRGSDSLLDARAKNWAIPSCSIVSDGVFSAVLCLFLFGGYLLSWQSLIPAGDQGITELTLFLPSKMLLYHSSSFIWEGPKCLRESVGNGCLSCGEL